MAEFENNNGNNNGNNENKHNKDADFGNLNDIFGSGNGNPYQNYGNGNPYQNYGNPYNNRPPYNPYNGMAGKLYPQPQRESKFVKAFVSIFIAVIIFAGGFLFGYQVIPSEEEKLTRWIKNTTDRYFYDVDGDGTDFTTAIGNGMVDSLDRFSSFYSGDTLADLKQENSGIFDNIGIVLYQEEGKSEVYILKVYGNSPADKAVLKAPETDSELGLIGIKTGDIIKKVNGEDVTSLTFYEVRNKVSEEQAKNSSEQVTLTFERRLSSGNITFKTTVAPAKYNPVFSKYYDSESAEMAGVALGSDTAYISFEEFSANADTQFANNLATFKSKGKKNLILDMRTNFGGSLAVLQNVASHLLTDSVNSEKVHIITARYKNGSTVKLYTNANYYNNYAFEKIIVLANGYSASATEVLICAMKDYGTIDGLVGTKTFGKAVMQQYFQYGNTYGMYITTAKLYNPVNSEYSYNGIGFEPDEMVEYNYSGDFVGDNQFIRAVQMAEAV